MMHSLGIPSNWSYFGDISWCGFTCR